MKLPWSLGKGGRSEAAGMPAAGADPNADHPPDLTGRRRFLAGHILIHTHIPKTAGSTLSHALGGIVGGSYMMDLRLKRAVRPRDMSDAEKRALHAISGHFIYGMHDRFPQKPLYFAAVRDPVERALSYFRFVTGAPNHPNHDEFSALGFEGSWDQMTGRAADTKSEEQSRILCGVQPGTGPDEATLWQRFEQDYLLVIPQARMDEAVRRLRAAFGLPWTRVPKMNASTAAAVAVSDGMRGRILAANRLDSALVARAERDFDARMDRAASYIAHHCLKDGG